MTLSRVQPPPLLILTLVVHWSQPVCVDVPSATEAVLGERMKLTCISCMKREEVRSTTIVDWYYAPNEQSKIRILQYKDGRPKVVQGPWHGRLTWNGSVDLQDISISIVGVTYNDTGTYFCQVFRQFEFDYFTPSITNTKKIELRVKAKASQDTTALYSEIMMYVLLVFLTLWLLVEMVYCYRKISRSDEQAQDAVTNYLAIPSEHKDNSAVPVTE
ncbi:sodium channel subunit beta-3 [Lampris incognitus]|uniref:sodium channel subunit beta-3 n=1 Tax=Lampris incognitus TaxID=2546036 RepID=UPI0024B5CB6A|nr:sodium channel subunit beta-3 [Lampris incognitus]